MESADLLIMGGGPAGLSVATGYRDASGAGSVLLISDEAVHPYPRPPLSKDFLRGDSSEDSLPLQPSAASPKRRSGCSCRSASRDSTRTLGPPPWSAADRSATATASWPRARGPRCYPSRARTIHRSATCGRSPVPKHCGIADSTFREHAGQVGHTNEWWQVLAPAPPDSP
jgi:hypothetical protein